MQTFYVSVQFLWDVRKGTSLIENLFIWIVKYLEKKKNLFISFRIVLDKIGDFNDPLLIKQQSRRG